MVNNGGKKRDTNAFRKDIFRAIKAERRRFISIMIITLLGVMMFSGLKASCVDLRRSADRFFDGQNLHDLQVVSTLGLTDDDITALSEIDGVETVSGIYSEDINGEFSDSSSFAATLKTMTTSGIDEPYILEGHLPQAANEVAATQKFMKDYDVNIGDTFTVVCDEDDSQEDTSSSPEASTENTAKTLSAEKTADSTDSSEDSLVSEIDLAGTDTDDISFDTETDDGGSNLTVTEFTIVGCVTDVCDINNPFGSVSYRTNSADSDTIFILNDAVDADYYTSVVMKLSGTSDLYCFSDKYISTVDEIKTFIEDNIRKDREDARSREVVNEAQAKLDDAAAEADEKISDAEKELKDAQEELSSGKAEGEEKIEDGKTSLEEELSSAAKELKEGQSTLNSKSASGRQELIDGQKIIDAAKAELASKKAELADGKAKANDGQAQLNAAKTELSEKKTSTLSEIEKGISSLNSGIDEINGYIAGVEAQIAALDPSDTETLAVLTAKLEALKAQKAGLETQLNTLLENKATAEAEFAAAEAEIEANQKTLDATFAEIASGEAQIAAGEAEIAANQEKINQGWEEYHKGIEEGQAKIDSGWEEYYSGKAEGESKIAEAEAELKDKIEEGQSKIDEGRDKLDDAKSKVQEKIDEAQAKIDDINTATWYVQDRTSLSGYANIDSDADSIEAISAVFPIVFFVVAILISLTAVTRMVDEDRGLIGTYKSLGYTDAEIRRKYMTYSACACASGCALGTAFAFIALPEFIFTIFSVMYLIPEYNLSFVVLQGLLGPVIFMAGILGATYMACKNELAKAPAALMRPKSPKSGSRVLLERIKPLWARLSFLNKVTARNLFRYKKRMFMTIFGIAGCMALLLFGFAIKDSVSDLSPHQYQDTFKYDILAVSSSDDNDKLLSYVNEGDAAASYMNIMVDSAKLSCDGTDESVTLIVVPSENSSGNSDVTADNSAKAKNSGTSSLSVSETESTGLSASEPESSSLSASEPESSGLDTPVSGGSDLTTTAFSKYISLKNLEGDELALNDGDVYVTQNAGNVLGFENGATVPLQLSDLQKSDINVTALVKNYLGNYVYMTENTFNTYFEDYAPNGVLMNLNDTVKNQAAYADDLASREGVISCTSTKKLVDSFSDTFQLINAVVYVIIIMSAALAFVVLFTLSTTNISERIRELATIKVLGFYDHEVHVYIDKETFILSAIGILIGMPLGWLFAQTLTLILKLPSIYLAVTLRPISFIYAGLLAIGFAVIVTIIMDRVLDKIDPVTALKSVE